MRLPCPICGSRDIREFSYKGAAVAIDRPQPDAPDEAWDVEAPGKKLAPDRTRKSEYTPFILEGSLGSSGGSMCSSVHKRSAIA